MSEFWTTVLTTAGAAALASSIISGIITSAANIWLQYRYDRKLEKVKADVQAMLDEHHIQFEYWHKEKANAVKTLYRDFTELSSSLQKVLACEKADNKNDAVIKRETMAMHYLTSITQQSFDDWRVLSLYLNDADNDKIAKFIASAISFSDLYDPNVNSFESTIVEQGKAIFTETTTRLYDLRVQFRKTLNILDEIDDNSNKKEVK